MDNEIVQIAVGIGLFILLALLAGLIGWLVLAVKRLEAVFISLDRALVPFGQSPLGHLANQVAQQGRTYVDEAADPAVIRVTDLLNSITFLVQLAGAANIPITRERVATWGRALFDALEALTDGVPAEGVPLAEREPPAPPVEGEGR